jgi:hypothetical protein
VDPLIFISHSTKEPAAEAALERLRSELPERLRWLDRDRLRAGENWRSAIHVALNHCRAAIVLLSPAALNDSDWVDTEITVLASRKQAIPRFVFLPILIAGAKADWLAKHEKWNDTLALSSLQAVEWTDTTTLPATVSAELERLVANLPGDGPLERLEDKLALELKKLVGPTVEAAAEVLELRLETAANHEEQALALARKLLATTVDRQFEALHVIARTDVQIAEDVWPYILPFGFIDPGAAGRVAALAEPQADLRAVAINANFEMTSQLYVQRVDWTWDRISIPTHTSEQDEAELLAYVRSWIVHRLNVGVPAPSTAELNRKLRERRGRIVVVLAPPAPEPSLIAALHAEWPELPVVLSCGQDTPEEFRRRRFDGVEYVLPPLDPHRETAALQQHNAALDTWEDLRRAASNLAGSRRAPVL